MAMKITKIDSDSPLYGKIKPGNSLLTINGEPVRDNVDYLFKSAEEQLKLVFENEAGDIQTFNLKETPNLGLTFENDKILICKNKCIFCFIHQQPKGMRRSLYIKDEDYRLSFTHGNFISMSNLAEADIERIIRQRLSPLYVSVHTTDDNLRRYMFGNKNLPAVVPTLKNLTDNGIVFHTQVVVCPGVNDSVHLDRTINELYALYPGVKTVGVVPVGLTKYRDNLPKLKRFTSDDAIAVIDYIESSQKRFLAECNSRFVFGADELYILAGHKLPTLSEYEEMEQFENGIGMIRKFLTDFNRRKRSLLNLKKKKNKKIVMMTGVSAYKIINENIISELKKKRFCIDVFPVINRFWGKDVTVSGLLTGGDLLSAVKKINKQYDVVLLPPNCLNNDDLFLDDLSLEVFRKKAGMEIKVGSYNLADTLKEVLA
jgi:putative radical SAM enzyme (TIGR03279 family)